MGGTGGLRQCSVAKSAVPQWSDIARPLWQVRCHKATSLTQPALAQGERRPWFRPWLQLADAHVGPLAGSNDPARRALISFPVQNESIALPDLCRIVTQVAAKGRSAGAQHRGIHVRSFAILLRYSCPSCRSLGFACVFESFGRLLQCRSPSSYSARSRGRGVPVAAGQVDGGRPSLGLSF